MSHLGMIGFCRHGDIVTIISAWASALLVLLARAMQEPQNVGRVTKYRLPRFFVRMPNQHEPITMPFREPDGKINDEIYMPRFIVTTKCMKNVNGVRIEPGMSVEVVTQFMSNPVLSNPQDVADAFMRIYGVDIRRAGILNMAYLAVEKI